MTDYDAYWLHVDCHEFIGIQRRHIINVIENPVGFGISREYIVDVYDKYNEPLNFEGKARKEIIIKLLNNGWIRLRRQRRSGSWHVNLKQLDSKVLSKLIEWAEFMFENKFTSVDDVLVFIELKGGLDKKKFGIGDLIK